jgi:hypothetical protein
MNTFGCVQFLCKTHKKTHKKTLSIVLYAQRTTQLIGLPFEFAKGDRGWGCMLLLGALQIWQILLSATRACTVSSGVFPDPTLFEARVRQRCPMSPLLYLSCDMCSCSAATFFSAKGDRQTEQQNSHFVEQSPPPHLHAISKLSAGGILGQPNQHSVWWYHTLCGRRTCLQGQMYLPSYGLWRLLQQH